MAKLPITGQWARLWNALPARWSAGALFPWDRWFPKSLTATLLAGKYRFYFFLNHKPHLIEAQERCHIQNKYVRSHVLLLVVSAESSAEFGLLQHRGHFLPSCASRLVQMCGVSFSPFLPLYLFLIFPWTRECKLCRKRKTLQSIKPSLFELCRARFRLFAAQIPYRALPLHCECEMGQQGNTAYSWDSSSPEEKPPLAHTAGWVCLIQPLEPWFPNPPLLFRYFPS